jgi:hypothetical protein
MNKTLSNWFVASTDRSMATDGLSARGAEDDEDEEEDEDKKEEEGDEDESDEDESDGYSE